MIGAIQNISCYKYAYSKKVQAGSESRDPYPAKTQAVTKDELGKVDLDGRNAERSIKSMTLGHNGNALNEQEIETYLIKDEMYTKTNGKWTRSMISGPIRSLAFDERNKLKGLADLISGSRIEVMGKETIDGKECYKLKVMPGMDTARSILASQAFEAQSSVPESLPPASLKGLLESDPLLDDGDISYTIWVTEDEYIPMMMEGETNFILTPASMRVKSKGIPDFRIDVAVEDMLVLSDFNDADDIEVPGEALAVTDTQ